MSRLNCRAIVAPLGTAVGVLRPTSPAPSLFGLFWCLKGENMGNYQHGRGVFDCRALDAGQSCTTSAAPYPHRCLRVLAKRWGAVRPLLNSLHYTNRPAVGLPSMGQRGGAGEPWGRLSPRPRRPRRWGRLHHIGRPAWHGRAPSLFFACKGGLSGRARTAPLELKMWGAGGSLEPFGRWPELRPVYPHRCLRVLIIGLCEGGALGMVCTGEGVIHLRIA